MRKIEKKGFRKFVNLLKRSFKHDSAFLQLKGDAGPPSAAGNPALPPQSTATASAMKPLHVQFAEGSGAGYPVRGEKQWQTWAQDLEDWGDK